jgi:hypothetical protein
MASGVAGSAYRLGARRTRWFAFSHNDIHVFGVSAGRYPTRSYADPASARIAGIAAGSVVSRRTTTSQSPRIAVCPRATPIRRDRGAAGLQARDRHPERRAGHVVEAGVVEEVDRLGVAAVLAADARVEVRLGRAALVTAIWKK